MDEQLLELAEPPVDVGPSIAIEGLGYPRVEPLCGGEHVEEPEELVGLPGAAGDALAEVEEDGHDLVSEDIMPSITPERIQLQSCFSEARTASSRWSTHSSMADSSFVPSAVQQLHLFPVPVKNTPSEKKHHRSFSDFNDPCTPRTIEDLRNISLYTNLIAFTLFELETITKSFRSDYILGEGGFGTVYKGYIDENVRVGLKSLPVAVKVLNKDGHQGHREWLTEVNFLGQLRHPNLVKLIGYCCEDDHRLLVYEFMFRGSLENHLFRKTAAPLSWATRMMIALGAAKGLAFLHNAERPVIYRDFKTSNILLDSDYTAKLSDFGLAKVGPQGDETHVSTRVMGTYGYAAPEYVMTGHLTARSDVYSFGVVLLELLTGRKAVDKTRPSKEQSLVDWARPKLNDKRKMLQIIDPRLDSQYSVRAAQKACSLAYYCLSQNPKARPLMSDVVETLEPLQGSDTNLGSIQPVVGIPDYRIHRRLTGNNATCRPTSSPKCSAGAVPACRVR